MVATPRRGGHHGQREGGRYKPGVFDANKTLTGLAGTEPVVGAQEASAQRLQFFLSEAAWDVD